MNTGLKRGIMLGMIAPIALAPLTAQAGTRASDNSTRYVASASAEPGLQRAAKGEDDRAGLIDFDLKWLLIGSAAIAVLLAVAIDGGETDSGFQSNGAN